VVQFSNPDIVITTATKFTENRAAIIDCSFVAGALIHDGEPSPEWRLHILSPLRARANKSQEVHFRIELMDGPLIEEVGYAGKFDLSLGDSHPYSYRFQQISLT